MASKAGAYRVTLRGIVQGVGFRPFVYREAERFAIRGRVWNNNGDVEILAAGDGFCGFIDSVKQNKPASSWIESISITAAEPFEADNFVIAESFEGVQDAPRFFSPDIAMCEQCRAEIFDKADRRIGHYFNNCTACGPRFSALKAFPYDRENTTMGSFPLCDDCLAEYNTPDNSRFHAETICCHHCGPVLHYKSYKNHEAFAEALKDLPKGIAIKGIGGYHLACSPYDEEALKNLRQLKGRETKPFALMFKDIAAITNICEVSQEEEKLLTFSARPIVLLKMKHNPFPDGLLGRANGRCACFLPYTPLHTLLLEKFPCLVMTSANLSSSPMIKDEKDIFALTDCVLYHNRKIMRSVEDSVVQVAAGKPSIIRRGRGFTPLPISLDNPQDIQLLAVGGDLKASFGMLKQQAFTLSQPFGDLEDHHAFVQYEQGITDFESLFAVKPQVVVSDMHPRYFSSILAKEMQLPLMQVQHHHAHIASVMAEHRLSRVLGIALDGSGYGEDGNIWGGEFLVCQDANCRRVGHLAYTKVIGADSAAKDATKTAECYLQAYGLNSAHPIIKAALENNMNTFYTSSMGRLFDAVSALLDICDTNSYEGECAMLLQYKAEEEERVGTMPLQMHFDIRNENDMHMCYFQDILEKCQSRLPGSALGFHNAICDMIEKICITENIKDIALSGGVFQNVFLLEKVTIKLTALGFNVFTNELVPVNDGGLALGQAFVALRKGNAHVFSDTSTTYIN